VIPDSVQCWVLVNKAMNLQVSEKAERFLTIKLKDHYVSPKKLYIS
jgi:hypothetical protein